ncbi:MAG: hypothetical protein R2748_13145 [Bryobacterales bacterium]
MKAFCPPDSRMPYEVWVAPIEPAAAFEDAPEELILQAAEMLHGLLGAMNAILERPPYHLLLYTAPFAAPDGFHWRIEIAPAWRASPASSSPPASSSIKPTRKRPPKTTAARSGRPGTVTGDNSSRRLGRLFRLRC